MKTPEQLREEIVGELMEASAYTRMNLMQATSDKEKDEIIEELREECVLALTRYGEEVRREEKERIADLADKYIKEHKCPIEVNLGVIRIMKKALTPQDLSAKTDV